MGKKKIAVLFGGRSVEHEISVLSAIQAMDALDLTKFDIIPVYIAFSGRWYTGDALRSRDFYKKGTAGIDAALKTQTEVILLPQPSARSALKCVKKQGVLGALLSRADEEIPVDVFLPVFHGQFGEDGCIQGLFEMAEVPYAGPLFLGTAIAMNKYICKAVLNHHGVPTLPSVTVKKGDALRDMQEACARVVAVDALKKFPLFVKPVNLGSSVGVSRVDTADALPAALMNVFQFDLEAIVEPCISRLMEINVSVIENGGKPEVSVVEIPVASGAFLSYEDKYLREGKGKKGGSRPASEGMASLARVINPTDLDPQYREGVQAHALNAYQRLNLSGVVRFDFMVDLDSGSLYFNELNPIPGSLSFYLWEKSSPPLLFSDILERMIEGAEARYIEKKQLKREFGFKAIR